MHFSSFIYAISAFERSVFSVPISLWFNRMCFKNIISKWLYTLGRNFLVLQLRSSEVIHSFLTPGFNSGYYMPMNDRLMLSCLILLNSPLVTLALYLNFQSEYVPLTSSHSTFSSSQLKYNLILPCPGQVHSKLNHSPLKFRNRICFIMMELRNHSTGVFIT